MIGWLLLYGYLIYFFIIMEIIGYIWEKSCGSFWFMMELWIFKSNIEWKLLVWNVIFENLWFYYKLKIFIIFFLCVICNFYDGGKIG